MVVRCLKCKSRLNVPDDKAGNPALRLKCPGCGLIFPVGKAPRAYEVARPASVKATGAADTLFPEADALAPGVASADPGSSIAAAGVVELPTPAATAPEPGVGKAAWLWCANHPTLRSLAVCVACNAGWCRDCPKRVQTALLCPRCEGLTVAAALAEEEAAKRERKRIPLLSQLDTILAYPLTDPLAFGLLSLFIWVLSNGRVLGMLLSMGLLNAYTFHAVMRASQGRYKFSAPEISSAADLFQPVLLGAGVYLVCYFPIFGMLWLFWGEISLVRLILRLLLVAPWALFYGPMALMIAAMSQSFFQTINPILGIGAMQRLGSVYGHVLIVATVLTLVQWGAMVGFMVLVPIPFVGNAIWSLLSVYGSLATGCAVGIAVEKKAVELGIE